jgi:hypothetical protein
MNINNWIDSKKKLEIVPDLSINIKEFYYYDKNDKMQFTDKFKNWGKK